MDRQSSPHILEELYQTIRERQRSGDKTSRTARLFAKGPKKIAQKVGEEAVETALASVAEDDESLLGEAADLIFHLTVLLRSRGLSVHDAVKVLRNRHVARRQAANAASLEP